MKSAEIQRSFSLHFIFRVAFLNFCCICLSMCTHSYNLKYFENKSLPWINTDSPIKTNRKLKSIAYCNIYIHRVKVRISKAWKIINTLNQNNQEVLKASKCDYSGEKKPYLLMKHIWILPKRTWTHIKRYSFLKPLYFVVNLKNK